MKNKNIIGINPTALVIATVLIFMGIGTAMATVWTDQADYTPGSTVTISGDNSDNTGYLSGEAVNVSINGPYQYDSKCSGIADSNGAWSCQITLSSDYTAEGSYTYTAVGQTSGTTQRGAFTDATVTAAPITIYKNDCISIQTIFTQGDVVCAKTTITTSGGGTGNLAIQWFGPSNNMVLDTTFTGQSNGATLTNTLTTTTASPTGTWTIKTCKGASATPCSGPSTLDTKTFTLNAPSDSTLPTSTISLGPTSPNGINDWYITNVHVTVAATDNIGGSGIAETRCVLDPISTPATFNDIPTGCVYTGTGADVATEGQHTIYTASKDIANNKETPISKSFKIDKTGPTAFLAVTVGTLGTNGWYTSDVTIHTSGTDAISDSVTCSTDQTISTSQTVAGSCTNGAGLTTDATPLTIKIDKLPPTVDAGTDKIVNSAVSQDATASDTPLGIVTYSWTKVSGPGDITFGTPDEEDTTISASADGVYIIRLIVTDSAGNSAFDDMSLIWDTIPPVVTVTASRVPDYNGWYNAPVKVTFSGTDTGGSGVASCDPDVAYN